MTRQKIFYGIQITITIFLVIFIVIILHSHSAKDVDQDTVVSAMLSDAEGLSGLKEGTAQTVKKNIGISTGDYDWVIYYSGEGALNVDELLIVKTDNSDAMEAAVSGSLNRLDTQITNFTNYGTNQIDLLNSSVSHQIGDYYFYCVSENASQWEEVFLNLVR